MSLSNGIHYLVMWHHSPEVETSRYDLISSRFSYRSMISAESISLWDTQKSVSMNLCNLGCVKD